MIIELIRSFAISEVAVAAIEYALIAALIAMVILSAVALTGTQTVDLWLPIASCFAAVTAGSLSP